MPCNECTWENGQCSEEYLYNELTIVTDLQRTSPCRCSDYPLFGRLETLHWNGLYFSASFSIPLAFILCSPKDWKQCILGLYNLRWILTAVLYVMNEIYSPNNLNAPNVICEIEIVTNIRTQRIWVIFVTTYITFLCKL